jgi:hypothetical protein
MSWFRHALRKVSHFEQSTFSAIGRSTRKGFSSVGRSIKRSNAAVAASVKRSNAAIATSVRHSNAAIAGAFRKSDAAIAKTAVGVARSGFGRAVGHIGTEVAKAGETIVSKSYNDSLAVLDSVPRVLDTATRPTFLYAALAVGGLFAVSMIRGK